MIDETETPSDQETPAADSRVEDLPEDPEELKKILLEEKEKTERYLANWQRAQADFVNYKRRTEQEQIENARFYNAKLIQNLLPVVDDFERAFDAIPPGSADAAWLEGIELVRRKLRAVIETEGVCEIKALGENFDPAFHEAVCQAKGEDGKVVEEIQKGYMLNDRVIRPAMVVVGEGEQDKTDEDS